MTTEIRNPKIPRKAFLWGWHSPSAIAAVQSVVASGKLEIPLWVRDGLDGTIEPRALIYRFEFPEDFSTSKHIRLPLAPSHLMTFMDMYSRVSRAAGMSVQEMLHACHVYCHYFASALESKKINLVMFAVPPHYGPDYLLYVIAKNLGIETVLCHQSLFPNRFFHSREIDDMGIYQQARPSKINEPFLVPEGFKKELFYMDKVKIPKTRPILSLINDLRKKTLKNSGKPLSISGVFQKFTESRQHLHAMNNKIHLSADLEKPYVYFPLQLQPEMTTSALGRGFSDQLTAIECISQIIPPDWSIFVKENPKQSYRQRGAHFFDRLSKIPNAVYINRKISTYALMEKARFVSTITGTAGWEAISGGKPVLVFGQPWYSGLPGVSTYRQGMDLNDILDKQEFSHPVLVAAFNERMTRTRKGVLDPHYERIVPSFSTEENTCALASFFCEVIEGRAHVPV